MARVNGGVLIAVSLAVILTASACGGGGSNGSTATTTPSFTSTPVTTAIQDRLYTYNVSTTTPNTNETLSITAPTLPPWLTLVDNGDDTAVLEGTPSSNVVGNQKVVLNVEDNASPPESSAQTFTIAVGAAYDNFQAANVVIGQADFIRANPNRGTIPGANTLNLPNGRPSNGSLYIPDSSNQRILGFFNTPADNNANADFVLGQDDFSSSNPGLSASAFRFPSDTWVDGTHLFVADFFNNRVMIWNSLPQANSPANIVVGQDGFDTDVEGTSQGRLTGPIAITTAKGKLFVADRDNNRVLIWNRIPQVSGAPADIVLGQQDFDSNAPAISDSGMEQPRGIWSDGERLAVSDAGNNRVLIWNSLPTENGQEADVVAGQPDLITKTAASGPKGLNNPRGIHSDGSRLFVADRNNNRVLIYNTFPESQQPSADIVIGHGNFNENIPNDDNQDGIEDSSPSARTLNGPTAVFVSKEQLFVTDNRNSRVLIFNRK